MITIRVLDQDDADRLLRLLYGGQRPGRVHTLICACGAMADLRRHPGAWDGWQLLPWARCPKCASLSPYDGPARERFLEMLGHVAEERKVQG